MSYLPIKLNNVYAEAVVSTASNFECFMSASLLFKIGLTHQDYLPVNGHLDGNTPIVGEPINELTLELGDHPRQVKVRPFILTCLPVDFMIGMPLLRNLSIEILCDGLTLGGQRIPFLKGGDDEEDGFVSSAPAMFIKGSVAFREDEDDYVLVSLDGACPGNHKPKPYATVDLYFNEDHPLNISQAASNPANRNAADIEAVITAVRIAARNDVENLCIESCSEYALKCIHEWVPQWKVNGWRTTDKTQPNSDRLEILAGVLHSVYTSMHIRWKHIKESTTSAEDAGNEEVRHRPAKRRARRL